jgi:hypothetical protein
VVVVLGVLVLDSTCEPVVEPIVPIVPYLATPAIVLDETDVGQSWEIVVMQRGRDALSTRCSCLLFYCWLFDLDLGFTRTNGFDEALEVDPIVRSFGEAAEDRSSASEREDLEQVA